MKQFRLFFTFTLLLIQFVVFAQEKTVEFKAFKEKYAGKELITKMFQNLKKNSNQAFSQN